MQRTAISRGLIALKQAVIETGKAAVDVDSTAIAVNNVPT
jgi:hypothetical protein